ncbi:MAG TPA: methyl-accepting chemotaxis protein [Aquabacterium sp.]|uniref:methyl-accepting chemotaxis protein n=1 Tax=Aquabacterium sp. TaxID=1872578 RepID=UPI002E35711F|nr:methyl-accepting chemotaxis protein [Aquabacterium sp.]HEX5357629.1 methyl-accepting chemotaxis protein [Aquabacterium sp.]
MAFFSLADIRLKPKLIALTLVVAGLGAIGGVCGLYGMAQLDSEADHLGQIELKGLDAVRAAEVALIDAGRARANAMLATTEETRSQRSQQFYKHVAEMQAALKAAEPTFHTEKGKKLFAETQQAASEWIPQADRFMTLMKGKALSNLDGEVVQADALTRDLNSKVSAAMDKLVERRKEAAHEAVERADALYHQLQWIVGGAIAGSLLAGVLIGWWVSTAIASPIQRAVKVAETVAQGDLTTRIDVEGSDETAQLLRALDRMTVNLVEIVKQVRESSDSIATGSSQIATGNASLSQRTEEQASNLEETAASMEQLTSTVKSNADTANEASRLASSAAVAATHGGQAVDQVVRTMHEISTSSRKITDIISVIDGIAFQTNILALNAAVEAARAGEQGRGFAVVAGEVRTLAQRSAQAAKEIKTLINDSVEKVDTGAHQVNNAGDAMSGIVAQVEQMGQLIAAIANASNEQSTGISQVGDAVNQLDQVTQQNAALVEESAAAAESLRHQAQQLAQVVGLFKVGA